MKQEIELDGTPYLVRTNFLSRGFSVASVDDEGLFKQESYTGKFIDLYHKIGLTIVKFQDKYGTCLTTFPKVPVSSLHSIGRSEEVLFHNICGTIAEVNGFSEQYNRLGSQIVPEDEDEHFTVFKEYHATVIHHIEQGTAKEFFDSLESCLEEKVFEVAR